LSFAQAGTQYKIAGSSSGAQRRLVFCAGRDPVDTHRYQGHKHPFQHQFATRIALVALLVVPAQAGTQYRKDMQERKPCVYILASKRNGTLYIGVTSDPIKRVWQHKNNVVEGFTKQYKVHRLVWFEMHETMDAAIAREKAIKEWKRAWKLRLIERENPEWQDLYETLL
jgi:putative endonuclease